MSVVSVIIRDDFALIMGDTKLNDNPNCNSITKVFKKDNILLGYTGNIRNVREYLDPIFTVDMQLNQNILWQTPDNPLGFINYLDNLFYEAKEQNKIYDVKLVVAIKTNNKYIAKQYGLFSTEHPQWENHQIVSDDELQCFYLGETVHFKFFRDLLENSIISTYEDIITIFQDTLDFGIEHDNTINNKMDWFTI